MDPTLATIIAAAIGGVATVVAAWLAHRQKAAAKQLDSASVSKAPETGAHRANSVTSSTGSQQIAKTVHPLPIEASAPRVDAEKIPSYFRKRHGTLIYSDGSQQEFVGFRCLWSDRLYYSRSLESLSRETYTSAPNISLDQLTQIHFSDRPNANVRRGIAQLRNGKTLENIFFYVEECSWWDDPGLQGRLNDPAIAALVFHGEPDV